MRAGRRVRRHDRRTLAITSLLVLALPLAAAWAHDGLAPPAAAADAGATVATIDRRPVSWTARTMGTYVVVTLPTGDSAAVAPVANLTLGVFRRVDSLMSNWTASSEVARINRGAASGPMRVHPEVGAVIDASLRLWRESDGAFDITVEPLVRAWGFLGGPRRVPADAELRLALARVGAARVRYDPATRMLAFDGDSTRIDLGGIAKGYAVDVAAESLKAHGVKDALVDLSGNMVALGSPAGGRGWRIGIRDPRDRIPYVARIAIGDGAISTSGQYEQFVARDGRSYGHILDPRTGRPAEGLISACSFTHRGLRYHNEVEAINRQEA